MNYTIGTKVFGDWIITKEIGSGSYGVVYEIEKNSYGVIAKSALKVIRIPASKADVKTALSEGMDEDSLVNYFEGCVEEIVKEIVVMSGLKNHPNIVTYEDHHVEKKQDEFGWDILIRMELLTALQDYQLSHKMTEEEIVRMAKDICNALVYCQERKIVHRDIKPENIFVNELGQFKLGDFGVAKTVDKTMGGLSKKGTEGYMAPEVYLGKSYGASVDIYSLGLMMYRLLNGNRMPFLPQAPRPITFQDRENSLVRRMQGEALPEPLYGNKKLKRVILKACAYHPEDRYWTAQEMLDALNECNQNEYTEEVILLTPNTEVEYEKKTEGTIGLWGEDTITEKKELEGQEKECLNDLKDINRKEKKKSGWRILLMVLLLGASVSIGFIVGYRRGAEDFGITEESVKEYAKGVIETMNQIIVAGIEEQYKDDEIIFRALNNYAEAYKQMGSYEEVTKCRVIYKNGIIIKSKIKCNLKSAEVKIVLNNDLEIIQVLTTVN